MAGTEATSCGTGRSYYYIPGTGQNEAASLFSRSIARRTVKRVFYYKEES